MFYPEEFKAEVKKLYPEDTSLHDCMEKGDEFVGTILRCRQGKGVSADTILSAEWDTVQKKAKIIRGRQALYKWWEELNKEQKKPTLWERLKAFAA